MQLSHRIALNGQQLDAVDPRIIIQGIEETAGKETVTTAGMATGIGTRITGRRRDYVDLLVKFKLNCKTSQMQARSELFESVNAWAAGGGTATINYKPGRRLRIDEVTAPAVGDARARNEYTITLRARTIPYWEDSTESTRVIGDDTATSEDEITVGGSAETQAGFELENTGSAAISAATVDIGGKTMYFTGLNLAVGDTLAVDHTDGKVRIRKNVSGSWVSAMGARTEASADDFRVQPGDRDCSYTADQDCTVTIKWRNRYL